jgi:hypothetical protein
MIASPRLVKSKNQYAKIRYDSERRKTYNLQKIEQEATTKKRIILLPTHRGNHHNRYCNYVFAFGQK